MNRITNPIDTGEIKMPKLAYERYSAICENLAPLLGLLPEEAHTAKFISALDNHMLSGDSFGNFDDFDRSLIQVLQNLGISPKEPVIAIWPNRTQYFSSDLRNLSKHIKEEWTREVDTVSFTDQSYSWVVTLNDKGNLGIIHGNS